MLVVTGVEPLFFQEKIRDPRFRVLSLQTDVGLVQKNSLEADYGATVLALEKFWQQMDRSLDFVEQGLGDFAPDLVVTDISPMGSLFAHRTGLSCVAMANFSWDWNDGADIQAGKDSIDKKMGSLYLEAELKYTICRTAENNLIKPSLRVKNSNYEIVFTKGSISQLATKASAVMHGECGKELGDFVFFPNGYEQLAFNTFNHSSMGLVTKSYVNRKVSVRPTTGLPLSIQI